MGRHVEAAKKLNSTRLDSRPTNDTDLCGGDSQGKGIAAINVIRDICIHCVPVVCRRSISCACPRYEEGTRSHDQPRHLAPHIHRTLSPPDPSLLPSTSTLLDTSSRSSRHVAALAIPSTLSLPRSPRVYSVSWLSSGKARRRASSSPTLGFWAADRCRQASQFLA